MNGAIEMNVNSMLMTLAQDKFAKGESQFFSCDLLCCHHMGGMQLWLRRELALFKTRFVIKIRPKVIKLNFSHKKTCFRRF